MRAFFSFVLILALHTTAQAQQAHQHGGGHIDIAIEKNTLLLELSIPAMNILGFEHHPGNDSEKRVLKQSLQDLKNVSRLFRINAGAGCKLANVSTQSQLLQTTHHHHHHTPQDAHSDFTASYEFVCNNSSQLRSLEVTLFDVYPATQYLELQLLTGALQQGGKISRENRLILLK